jgi:hypothetical protein
MRADAFTECVAIPIAAVANKSAFMLLLLPKIAKFLLWTRFGLTLDLSGQIVKCQEFGEGDR